MIKRLSSKLKSKRGETLLEALVAILIIAISTALLGGMTLASASINKKAVEAMKSYYSELAIVEEGNGTNSAKVWIVDNDYSSEPVDVRYSGGEGELKSYRAVE